MPRNTDGYRQVSGTPESQSEAGVDAGGRRLRRPLLLPMATAAPLAQQDPEDWIIRVCIPV